MPSINQHQLTPTLAVLLVHDFLLAKKGIAAPGSHPLKTAIERHKSRLNAEFTRIRVRRGFASVQDFRNDVEIGYSAPDSDANGNPTRFPHPRWVRSNPLVDGPNVDMKGPYHFLSRDATYTTTLSDIMREKKSHRKLVYIDRHVPCLFALPPGFDLSDNQAYNSGALIIQDKASCFPALMLRNAVHEGDVIDACAAPGNKTTHLAALMKASQNKVFAFERDSQRTETLYKMVKHAGADRHVRVFGNTDFFDVDPRGPTFRKVRGILLDPSCSGSGIVGRDDEEPLMLPQSGSQIRTQERSLKRKHEEVDSEEAKAVDRDILPSRIERLAKFQLKLLLRAMQFPNVVMISYSTCSVHAEENEAVVVKALTSKCARERGWRLMTRAEQFEGLSRWDRRGDADACAGLLAEHGQSDDPAAEDIAEACIRCEKGAEEGTMGFFVAGFVRPYDDPALEEKFQNDRASRRAEDIKARKATDNWPTELVDGPQDSEQKRSPSAEL